jgi:hypothetical protein
MEDDFVLTAGDNKIWQVIGETPETLSVVFDPKFVGERKTIPKTNVIKRGTNKEVTRYLNDLNITTARSWTYSPEVTAFFEDVNGKIASLGDNTTITDSQRHLVNTIMDEVANKNFLRLQRSSVAASEIYPVRNLLSSFISNIVRYHNLDTSEEAIRILATVKGKKLGDLASIQEWINLMFAEFPPGAAGGAGAPSKGGYRRNKGRKTQRRKRSQTQRCKRSQTNRRKTNRKY